MSFACSRALVYYCLYIYIYIYIYIYTCILIQFPVTKYCSNSLSRRGFLIRTQGQNLMVPKIVSRRKVNLHHKHIFNKDY